jgi:hypothetical protein
MLNSKNEIKVIIFALIFSTVTILSSAAFSYPGAIINMAYAILVISTLLLAKYLLDKRKSNK